MASRQYAREKVPLSRFGVLVAQLESIVASAAQQQPDSLLCFDLLSDLISVIHEEPKDSILSCQRKCEDALHSLIALGLRRPVRHLASIAIARIILKGDPISIYSRASSLQGFLSDGKKTEPQKVAGAAQCLGELYRAFGGKISSGLPEIASLASKLMKYNEEYVRKEALQMLQNALEGCGGTAASTVYTEAFRLIMGSGVSDKSFNVRKAAATCLKAFANIGGPALGVVELENAASICVKGLDDPVSTVRDAFAEALGAVLALGMNPESQVQARGKGQVNPPKKLEGCLQKYLVTPFVKATGTRSRVLRVGLTLSWVSFLQATCLKYSHPDDELQDYAVQILGMLLLDTAVDAQALACILYILRVGVTDQMTELTQRGFSVVLGKQLQSPDASPAMKVAALRTLSYTLKTLGEVPMEFKNVLEDTVVAALSHSFQLVRVEAALTLRTLAAVDPMCVGGLISYGITALKAFKENIIFETGSNLILELDAFHGQATMLSALVSVSPKLPLGYPARLPMSVLEVAKRMLTESNRNSRAAIMEKEVGWLLLSSLLASMPKEEFKEQVFDILTLWAPVFGGNTEHEVGHAEDLLSKLCIWSSSVDALTTFIRCFVCPGSLYNGILLQPVLVYLSRVLSFISYINTKKLPNIKPAMDVLIIRTLIAFQSLPGPTSYKSDHSQIIQLCTAPFRTPAGWEASSCLRMLLDKRDAWLGPWTPGRDWLEDELRAFQGGKDGLMPCVWDLELPSFPQPETVSKMVVNQMLLCFGNMFAFQDSAGMLSLLTIIQQCLKSGRRQSWHSNSVTNICVGLLAALKALLTYHPEPLGSDILSSLQSIFQDILAAGDICASQRRAASEGLGFLTRLGNDAFAARLTKSLLSDLTGTMDSYFAGSIALALGCIHRSAGGMALSTLVPATVNSISLLAKSPVAVLQKWSLHGLLLTIEAAGLSYVSHVQATLILSLEILLADENGCGELYQGVGSLVNAIVAVLGPELSPGSIFFSRCKYVIAEISSSQEMATLLESVRFTQQLALCAPQALSTHSHVQTLLPTLSSRQPALRHLAISTLRHLIEKDAISVIAERIEENLFHMMDEETDPEIGKLVRSTIMRLLYVSSPSCPSHWISIFRKMVLAVSTSNLANSEHDPGDELGHEDDNDNMVYRSKSTSTQDYRLDSSSANLRRDKVLRYRTKAFAAECLSHITRAVGKNPAHFDLTLAKEQSGKPHASNDWLVFQLQELISLAYQISTIQFENMQPIGVGLLSDIIDKFETVPDLELPGRFLLEQYQAQFLSALRSALDASAGPVLLEAGLQLATKILTSGIIHGDQLAVKRIFSFISRPLDDFKELYYPSFAEWVSCKIKVRLLAAHASLKCHTYAFLRRQSSDVPDESIALLPLFSKCSSMLGKRWIWTLKDHCHICFNLCSGKNWKPFLDGIQSPMVSSKLKPCLEEAWPVILQALVLDAVPANANVDRKTESKLLKKDLISGYSMVELELEEYHFLWGLASLILFHGKSSACDKQIVSLASIRANYVDSPVKETKTPNLMIYEVVFPVFQFLCTERFFAAGFFTVDLCTELIQLLTYVGCKGGSCDSLAAFVLVQMVQNCPDQFLDSEVLSNLITELCLNYLFKICQRAHATTNESTSSELISQLLITARTLLSRFGSKKQLKSMLAFILVALRCIREASSESTFSKINEIVHSIDSFLKTLVEDAIKYDENTLQLLMIIQAGERATANLARDCIEAVQLLENRKSSVRRLVHSKLAFSLEQTIFFAGLAYTIEFAEDRKHTSSINVALLADCLKRISLVLNDRNIQVQAIGLQVLKNAVQKRVGAMSDSFVVFLTAELFGVILMIVENILKESFARDSSPLVMECLKTLMLMETLPMACESQKGFMSILLEVIVMVLAKTEDASSQESEMRNSVTKLVSTLARIPSTAVHLRDVLLEMPAIQRRQIQDIIRASVTQEQTVTPVKPSGPTLEIKLPYSSDTKGVNSQPTPLQPTGYADEDDEEDDWDTFQSFPASTSQADLCADDGETFPEQQHSLVEETSIYKSNIEVNEVFKDVSSTLTPGEEGSDATNVEETSICKSNIELNEEFKDVSSTLTPGEGEGSDANNVEEEAHRSASDDQDDVEIDVSEKEHVGSRSILSDDDPKQSTFQDAIGSAQADQPVSTEENTEENLKAAEAKDDVSAANDSKSLELESDNNDLNGLSDDKQMVSAECHVKVQGETSGSVDLPEGKATSEQDPQIVKEDLNKDNENKNDDESKEPGEKDPKIAT